MTEWAGLEIRKAACPLRGFESLSLRKQGCKSADYAIYALYYTQNKSLRKTLCIPFVTRDICIRVNNPRCDVSKIYTSHSYYNPDIARLFLVYLGINGGPRVTLHT